MFSRRKFLLMLMLFVVIVLMGRSVAVSGQLGELPSSPVYQTVGKDAVELLSQSDLDVIEVNVASDATNIYINVTMLDVLAAGGLDKTWNIELDVDGSSRTGSWAYDYYVSFILYSNGNQECKLIDSSFNVVNNSVNFDGGSGYKYIIVKLERGDFTSPALSSVIYIVVRTYYSTSNFDVAPEDGTGGNDFGDYYLYYLDPPPLSPTGTSISDDTGDIGSYPSYLDIWDLSEGYDSTTLQFQLTIVGNYLWGGGYDAAVYVIYIDANNDGTYDYKINYTIGWIPRLVDLSSSSSVKLNYKANPGGTNKVLIIVPKSDLANLGSSIKMYGETYQGGTRVDTTTAAVAPVPELGLIASVLMVAVVPIVILLYSRRIR